MSVKQPLEHYNNLQNLKQLPQPISTSPCQSKLAKDTLQSTLPSTQASFSNPTSVILDIISLDQVLKNKQDVSQTVQKCRFVIQNQNSDSDDFQTETQGLQNFGISQTISKSQNNSLQGEYELAKKTEIGSIQGSYKTLQYQRQSYCQTQQDSNQIYSEKQTETLSNNILRVKMNQQIHQQPTNLVNKTVQKVFLKQNIDKFKHNNDENAQFMCPVYVQVLYNPNSWKRKAFWRKNVIKNSQKNCYMLSLAKKSKILIFRKGYSIKYWIELNRVSVIFGSMWHSHFFPIIFRTKSQQFAFRLSFDKVDDRVATEKRLKQAVLQIAKYRGIITFQTWQKQIQWIKSSPFRIQSLQDKQNIHSLIQQELQNTQIQQEQWFGCSSCIPKCINNTNTSKQCQKDSIIAKQYLPLPINAIHDQFGIQIQRRSFQKMLQKVNTFDLILLKNPNFLCRMQRVFTFSEYDHVGLAVRTSQFQVYVFDANRSSGVTLYNLQLLKGVARAQQTRVAIRPYLGEKTTQNIIALQNFICSNISKQYHFNLLDLVTSNRSKSNKYFCSELVAKALQHVGIINNRKPAHHFLPKHFCVQELNDYINNGRFSDPILIQ